MTSDREFLMAVVDLRFHLRLGRTDMAEKLGVGRNTFWRYESGKGKCEPESRLKLARLATDSGRPDLACIFLAPFSSQLGISPERLVREMRRVA